MFIVLRLLIALALLSRLHRDFGAGQKFPLSLFQFFLRDPMSARLRYWDYVLSPPLYPACWDCRPRCGRVLCGLAIGHSTLRPAALRTAPPVII